MRASFPLPTANPEHVESIADERQIIDFPVFDVSPAISGEPEKPETLQQQLMDEVALLIEEKHTVVQLSATAMQRLAATNQLATANLGMLSCNATESGRVIEASIGAVAGRISSLRASSEVQSLMVGSLVTDIEAQAQQHSALVEASIALQALSRALQATMSAFPQPSGLAVPVVPAPVADLVLSTSVGVEDVAARIRSLDHGMQQLRERGRTLREATGELQHEATGGEADCLELKAANRIVTSLVSQMDLMIQPMRQIAQSCSSVHANLAMTADGLMAIQARLFEAAPDRKTERKPIRERDEDASAFV